MKLKTLMALAVAAAFAVPLAAQASAQGDSMLLASGPAGTSSTGTGMTGGTPSTRSSGEPRAPTQAPRASASDFSRLDRNGDGQVSRAEWDAHYRSGSAGATTSPVPAAPGTRSQAGSGSDTATTPGTSGKGAPK